MTAPRVAAVELRGVSKVYGVGETSVAALRAADLCLYGGEVLLIQGPSGSGKTTLLSLLGLLARPSTGSVHVQGRDTSGLSEAELPAIRARTFGFVFQGFNLFGALSALENVSLGVLTKRQSSAVGAQAEASCLLHAVGLDDRMHHLPRALSGGQKQRVAIARALCGDSQVILADEPTAALDSTSALAVMSLLRSLAVDRQRAVAVVTHDHRLQQFAHRIVRVEDGHVLSAGAALGS
jgi:putative ABC transport system ATP-binding protein